MEALALASGGVLEALGGLGLFLLGMIVMTDGLRRLAGSALRRVLARFTRSPLSGAVTGAVTTAIVQSSSATTVTAVGFVGAGLLAFPQALGIVFGANLGTTMTGWIVAVVGFELELTRLAYPILFAGVLARLFGSPRVQAIGFALAGFGTIFVGIDALQQGMAGFEGSFAPERFPSDTFSGRLLLVGLGIAITLVTQSSSAGVATALTALHVGTLSFPQAAAMVIGMDVGTTFTAALATVGGSSDVRRTGWAHVTYNVLTGVGAFLLLSPYVDLLDASAPDVLTTNPELALVAFHTLFNALGVVAILPFARPFAHLMEVLIPQREAQLGARLDRSLLSEPDAAIQALTSVLGNVAQRALECFLELLDDGGRDVSERLLELQATLGAARAYVERMRTSSDQGRTHLRHVSAMHAIDHLDRLVERCMETVRAETVRDDPELARLARRLCDSTRAILAPLGAKQEEPDEALPESAWRALRAATEPFRRSALRATAAGEFDSLEAEARLDAMRWLHRVAYHAWRVVHHLRRCHFDVDLELTELSPTRTESPD